MMGKPHSILPLQMADFSMPNCDTPLIVQELHSMTLGRSQRLLTKKKYTCMGTKHIVEAGCKVCAYIQVHFCFCAPSIAYVSRFILNKSLNEQGGPVLLL